MHCAFFFSTGCTTQHEFITVYRISQAHLDNERYQRHNIAERFTRSDGSEMLYIGRESIMPGQSAWPLPHDAPYTAVINRHLMAVVEVR